MDSSSTWVQKNGDASSWHMVNFFLVFVALILIIIVYFIFFDERDKLTIHGAPWSIQNGTNTTTEAFNTTLHNLYISNRGNKDTLTLRIDPNTRAIGSQLGIRNFGTGVINVVPAEGVKIDLVTTPKSEGSFLIPSNNYTELVITAPNTYQRLFDSD